MGQICSYILDNPDDSQANLAIRSGFTPANVAQYVLGSTVCYSPSTPPDPSPQPNPDGTCYAYIVEPGDDCAFIASNHHITADDIELYNPDTWGWLGCPILQPGAAICLSPGDPPTQAAAPGPCDSRGQRGITPEFCTVSQWLIGTEGTAPHGVNTCISNCGTDPVSSAAPAQFFKIGYFEAFNLEKNCFTMTAGQIPSGYSHVHFAFAGVTSSFAIDLSSVQDQLELFAQQTGFKRILSFGGRSFSNNHDAWPVFREEVTAANIWEFADNIVSIVDKYHLDGVNLDWGYASLTNIPPGGPGASATYLEFLRVLRSLLPAEKSISMAVPASYGLLKGTPIADMSHVLDYIVYKTFDLHGQWDYGNPRSQDCCPLGNCLRSHVNLTETMYSLAMITKAGVPSNKIVVGIASYGRTFGMTNFSCTGEMCTFGGRAWDSTAAPLSCTNTPGFISLSEIELVIASAKPGTAAWRDSESDSDLLTYRGTWGAYMGAATKASRIALYRGLHFGGTAEWAIDMDRFAGGWTGARRKGDRPAGTATVSVDILNLPTGTIIWTPAITFTPAP